MDAGRWEDEWADGYKGSSSGKLGGMERHLGKRTGKVVLMKAAWGRSTV